MPTMTQSSTNQICFPLAPPTAPSRGETAELIEKREAEINRDYFSSSQSGAAITIQRVLALANDPDEDLLPPTIAALVRTSDLIFVASSQMEHNFPRGSAATDGKGGLRVEWRSANLIAGLVRDVRLLIPSLPCFSPTRECEQEYIFHGEYHVKCGMSGDSDQYEIEPVSFMSLAEWLDWLLQI